MFWFIYIAASIFLSLIISRLSKNFRFEGFIIFLVTLITPAQIEISLSDYAPALFSFSFNFFFGEEFSTRLLRPLLISLPLTLIFLILYSYIKKRFF
jgi:hypothetical protein